MDEQLEKIKQGSRKDFDEFYEQYVHFVFRIAVSILKNKQDAEDVCQEIFTEVLQKPNKYDPEKGSVHAWLAVKTKSRCLDHLKKKQPILTERLDDLIGNVESTELNVLNKAKKEAVRQAVNKLPAKQQDVLYSVYFEERTHKEIAQKMKRQLGTVKSRISKELKNLRKQSSLLHWVKAGGGGKK